MKELVFCCFTCKRDEALLPLHYAAIQLAAPGAPVVYAVDASEDVTVPAGAQVMRTSWPRKGNLLGLPALVGILHALLDVAEKYNAIPVKIDSDIMLTGVKWLEPLLAGRTEMMGICPGQLFCASGACYGITADTVKRILFFLRHGVYWDTADIRVEDETISMMAAMVNQPYRVTFLQHAAPGWIMSCIFKDCHFIDSSPLLRCQAFVDCGDKKFLSTYNHLPEEWPTLKLKAMQKMLDTLTPTTPGQGIS